MGFDARDRARDARRVRRGVTRVVAALAIAVVAMPSVVARADPPAARGGGLERPSIEPRAMLAKEMPAKRGTACAIINATGAALGERVEIEAIEAADRVRLTDGRIIRLALIGAPRDPLAGPRPMADTLSAARDRLAELVGAAREVRFVALDGERVDRHGRVAGRLIVATPEGLVDAAEHLARLGAARFDRVAFGHGSGGVGLEGCGRAILAAETEARASRRGLFADAAFGAQAATAPDLLASAGAVVTVEGRVLSLGHAGRTTYVNFGDRYQRDFTAWLSDKDRAAWLKSGVDIATWSGQWVRLSGPLGARDGGSMRLVDPWQVERIASPETTEAGGEK